MQLPLLPPILYSFYICFKYIWNIRFRLLIVYCSSGLCLVQSNLAWKFQLGHSELQKMQSEWTTIMHRKISSFTMVFSFLLYFCIEFCFISFYVCYYDYHRLVCYAPTYGCWLAVLHFIAVQVIIWAPSGSITLIL